MVDEYAPFNQRSRLKAEILHEKAKILKRTKEKDNFYGSAAANLYEDVSSCSQQATALTKNIKTSTSFKICYMKLKLGMLSTAEQIANQQHSIACLKHAPKHQA